MATTQGVKLDEETRRRLRELGKLKNRSPHFLMKAAIEAYLEQEESYEREKREDLERWERYQLTGEAVPHKDAAAWMNRLVKGEASTWPE